MKIASFSHHNFETSAFASANETFHQDLLFIDESLTKDTASLAAGHLCVSAFTTDILDDSCLNILQELGVQLIALRSAGFNHIDLKAATRLKLTVTRVPEYSPYSVAEYAVALMLTLNRKTHRSFNRVRELNFSLEGLVGFDMHGKTVGIIGTGRIGSVLAKIVTGFGCRVLVHDLVIDELLVKDLGVAYVPLPVLLKEADIISLHVPLNDNSRHLISETSLQSMKEGVMLINTGRGGLVDSKALVTALKSGHIGSAGLDVYEEEEVFFQDHSSDMLQDDVLARLLTFPNVFLSSHQGFLTQEALNNIAHTTLESAADFERGESLKNSISYTR